MADFKQLQTEHEQLLAYAEQTADKASVARTAADYIARVRAASSQIGDPRQRDQLRANLRYWGAFVYEHTGEYPNSSLQPATVAAPPVAPPPVHIPWGLIIGAAAIVGVVVGGIVLGSILVFGVTGSSMSQSATDFLEDTVATAVQATLSAEDTTSEAGEEPTATPLPTNTLAPGETAVPTNTPSPTATATPVPPTEQVPDVTEPEFARSQFFVDVAVSPNASCRQRIVAVNMTTSSFDVSNTPIAVYFLGSFQPVLFANFNENGQTVLDFGEFGSTDSSAFLVRIANPQLPVSDTIVQFSSDCSRNAQTLTYRVDLGPSFIRSDTLTDTARLDWTVLSWGPSPFNNQWVAVVELFAFGGDGNYVFWADGLPLEGSTVTLFGQACQPARLPIGLTTAGQATLTEINLTSPFCP